MEWTCVVLAAGRAARMGGDKLLLPFGAGTLLDRALAACGTRPACVVASPGVAQRLYASETGVQTIVNEAPERGMSWSLRLADEAIEPARSLAILLGDKPLAGGALVERMIAAAGANDVTYPVHDGVPGHPVLLSPRARALIRALPDGDSLNRLRDDPRLVRAAVPVDDAGAYVDVDTEEDYRRVLPEAPG